MAVQSATLPRNPDAGSTSSTLEFCFDAPVEWTLMRKPLRVQFRGWAASFGDGATGLPDIPVHSIVVDPANPDRLYLGTDLGVMTSINGGRSWAVENTGFANAVTEWLALGTDAGGQPWLFAFTHGRGAWKVALNSVPPPPRRPSGRRTQ